MKSLEAQIESLKSDDNSRTDINISSEEQKKWEQKVHSLQQIKRNSIIVMGLKETANENTVDKMKDLFINKLTINRKYNEIGGLVAYRVGQQSSTNDKPRHALI